MGGAELPLTELIGAFHREEREASDAELDAALGLPSWRAVAEESVLEERHPGASVPGVPTPYVICRGLFHALALTRDDLFVDLGCGDGRVVFYGALTTPARFRGVELVAERAGLARANAARLGLPQVEIVHGDALALDLSEGSVFYAFRPFSPGSEPHMLARLHEEARRRPIVVAAHRMLPSLFDPEVFEPLSTGLLLIHRSRAG
jgi:SAM-dependent methyltransferase